MNNTQVATQAASPQTLGKFAVKKAKPSSPRILIYGQGGVGKTTFAAKFPKPFFVCTEKGLNSDGLAGTDYTDEVNTWHEFLELLKAFKESAYKTLVIDTLDNLIGGIFNKYICQKMQNPEAVDFATIDYGKGTVVAQQEIKSMLNILDDLNGVGKIIVVIAHSQVKMFNNPTGKDYDTYMLKGNDKINDVIKCWADEVYFATFITTVDKDGKATGGKTRWLETENSPAWFAKSRFGLNGLEMDAKEVIKVYAEKIRGAKNEQSPN